MKSSSVLQESRGGLENAIKCQAREKKGASLGNYHDENISNSTNFGPRWGNPFLGRSIISHPFHFLAIACCWVSRDEVFFCSRFWLLPKLPIFFFLFLANPTRRYALLGCSRWKGIERPTKEWARMVNLANGNSTQTQPRTRKGVRKRFPLQNFPSSRTKRNGESLVESN